MYQPFVYNTTEIRKAEIYFTILTHEYNHIYTSKCIMNVSALFYNKIKIRKVEITPSPNTLLLPLTCQTHPHLSPSSLTLISHPHFSPPSSHPHPRPHLNTQVAEQMFSYFSKFKHSFKGCNYLKSAIFFLILFHLKTV